jgi:hypothetical protein
MASAKSKRAKRAREACGNVIGEVKLKTGNGLLIAKPKKSKPKTKKDKTGKSTTVKAKKKASKKSSKPKTKRTASGASKVVKSAKKGAKKATKKGASKKGTKKSRAKKRGETATENKQIAQAKKDAKKATPKKGKKGVARKRRTAGFGPLADGDAYGAGLVKARAASGKRAAKKLSKFFEKLGKEIQKREKQQSTPATRAALASSDSMKAKLAAFKMKRGIAKAMKSVDAAADAANVPEPLTPGGVVPVSSPLWRPAKKTAKKRSK